MCHLNSQGYHFKASERGFDTAERECKKLWVDRFRMQEHHHARDTRNTLVKISNRESPHPLLFPPHRTPLSVPEISRIRQQTTQPSNLQSHTFLQLREARSAVTPSNIKFKPDVMRCVLCKFSCDMMYAARHGCILK